MANGNRKQVTFDLSQDALKQHYPHKEPVTNPQYYKGAYGDIQRFMVRNGFEHRQYSVYVSKDRLTTLDVVGLMEQLAEQMPWLSACVNEIDVTNIGVQHGLKQTLESATKELDVDLEVGGVEQEASTLSLDLELVPSAASAVNGLDPAKEQMETASHKQAEHKRKRRREPER